MMNNFIRLTDDQDCSSREYSEQIQTNLPGSFVPVETDRILWTDVYSNDISGGQLSQNIDGQLINDSDLNEDLINDININERPIDDMNSNDHLIKDVNDSDINEESIDDSDVNEESIDDSDVNEIYFHSLGPSLFDDSDIKDESDDSDIKDSSDDPDIGDPHIDNRVNSDKSLDDKRFNVIRSVSQALYRSQSPEEFLSQEEAETTRKYYLNIVDGPETFQVKRNRLQNELVKELLTYYDTDLTTSSSENINYCIIDQHGCSSSVKTINESVITVGRYNQNDIFTNSHYTSRFQFILIRSSKYLLIIDSWSMSGTKVVITENERELIEYSRPKRRKLIRVNKEQSIAIHCNNKEIILINPRLCIVCEERCRQVKLVCNHAVLCVDCHRKINSCPICRGSNKSKSFGNYNHSYLPVELEQYSSSLNSDNIYSSSINSHNNDRSILSNINPPMINKIESIDDDSDVDCNQFTEASTSRSSNKSSVNRGKLYDRSSSKRARSY